MPPTPLDLERLKKATDLRGVAALLNVKPSQLSNVLYLIPPELKYHTFNVPKKRGGERVISAPDRRLKYIQKQLAEILLRIEQDLERARAKNAILSHGFKKKLSAVTNAARHRNKRFVFNIDLEDFFPSINFGRVRGFFMSNRNFALTKDASTVLAQIACHESKLPQGSPSSPPISNLIANILDIRLNKIARECRCTYSRYADDITFSSNEREFPQRIAVRDAETGKWYPSGELKARIAAAGFRINDQKTRMQFRDSRQDTTGVIVNKKLNVPKEYYRDTRAMCHRMMTGGEAFLQFGATKVPIAAERLRGRLNHIYHVRSLEGVWKKSSKTKAPAYHELYARFLDYISFWAIQQPMIVCEGKTDPIYLRSAIRALKGVFPEFVEEKDGKERIKVGLFKYTKAARTVQDLSGGSGQLKNLVAQYAKRTKGFGPLPKHPVIVITDVDEGARGLFSSMAQLLGKPVNGDEPWYHIGDNLYVVTIPHEPGAQAAIEDLFEKKVTDIEWEGRKFDRTNEEEDSDKHYSKFTFATKIIASGHYEVDYKGFEPLLKAIGAVQAHYAIRLAAGPAVTATAA